MVYLFGFFNTLIEVVSESRLAECLIPLLVLAEQQESMEKPCA